MDMNNFNLSNLNLSNRDTCQFEQKRISVATAVGSRPLCLDRRCDFNDSHWGVAKSKSHSLFLEFRSHLRLSSLKSKSPSFCLDFLASNHGKFHPKSFSCWSHDLGTLLDGVAWVTTTMVFCWKAAKSIHFTCGMARVQSFEQEEWLHSSKCCRCLLCHTDR